MVLISCARRQSPSPGSGYHVDSDYYSYSWSRFLLQASSANEYEIERVNASSASNSVKRFEGNLTRNRLLLTVVLAAMSDVQKRSHEEVRHIGNAHGARYSVGWLDEYRKVLCLQLLEREAAAALFSTTVS